jgi:hypothetical protein
VSYLGGNSGGELGSPNIAPMDIEEDSPPPGREWEVQNNEFVHHLMFFKMVFLLGRYVKEVCCQFVWKYYSEMSDIYFMLVQKYLHT